VNKKNAKKALQELAKRKGISVDIVRGEIEAAIAAAYENSDPDIQPFWRSVPHRGKLPTPEETIAFIADIICKIQ